MKDNLIFITGYAKLPQGITASELYSVIVVGVSIHKKTGVIEDIDCSLVTASARTFVKKMCVGQDIDDYDALTDLFNEHYHGSARKALLSALKNVNEKYRNLISQEQ